MKRIVKELFDIIIAIGIALILYLALGVVLKTEIPLVAVEGHSMEPTYHVGDLLIIKGVSKAELKLGDVIVYERGGTRIVHRLIAKNHKLITKGDNNPASDPPISFEQVKGKVIFKIPWLGWPKIILSRLLTL